MAFCVQCGNKVGDADQFCAKCGAHQKAAARPVADPMAGMSGRNASLLCYIPWVGWIAAIVVLASNRFRHDAHVRFNAFQGLYVFVAWLMVEWVFKPFLLLSGFLISMPFHRFAADVLQLLILAAWVFMLIKVSQDENYKLPIIGDLAERSVSEQRS